MNETCGCCEGVERLTPSEILNRPGLDALRYRVGTHAGFFETMQARLAQFALELALDEFDAEGRQLTATYFPLRGLTTRERSDPAIALLDAWATIADVLTFYQERIANEGYLRTATERRSILELARLIGYALRPGVAASVFLAYTLDAGHDVTILPGNRAQSVPGPGELPQSFETAEKLDARADLNALAPRLSQPQYITRPSSPSVAPVYFKGIATGLKPNDALLFAFSSGSVLYQAREVTPDRANDRTLVTLTLRDLQAIHKPSDPPPPVDALMKTVDALLAKYAIVRDFGVDPDSATAKTVLDLLKQVSEPQGDLNSAERLQILEDVLPRLRDEYASASARGYVKLAAWLGAMTTDLASAITPPAGSRFGAGATFGDAPSTLPSNGIVKEQRPISPFIRALQPLKIPPSIQPANALRLDRSVAQLYAAQADTVPRLFTVLYPQVRTRAYDLLAGSSNGAPDALNDIHALRVQAGLFGSAFPPQPVFVPPLGQQGSKLDHYDQPTLANAWGALTAVQGGLATLALDAQYDKITPDSYVAIERPDAAGAPQITYHEVASVRTATLAALGASAKVTILTLKDNWLSPAELDTLRGQAGVLGSVTVYAQSERLTAADEPLTDDIAGDRVELGGLYRGLEAGRWAIVAGERTDIKDSAGRILPVQDAELVMLAEVAHDLKQITDAGKTFALPGDVLHTFVRFAGPLAYTYKRSSVTIYGNVVRATHGETRSEALGSGDGSKALQTFALRQSPLTYLSAPTPAGAESTLALRVNDILWHEAGNIAALGPTDHRYILRTDDDNKTSVTFGNGKHGARLPTGVENVKAIYRTGIGKPGNVGARKISLLATKPLGVKSVINPLPASGGSDRESIIQARRNAPIGAIALDRLVSVSDYADFARTFAGIGKADATLLSNGQRQMVYLTIAGADNIPIATTSDLYRNLRRALRLAGDPYQPVAILLRELRLLVIRAGVRILPDYLWEAVEPQIRAALLNAFSFERRELGQGSFQAEAISAIQATPGVAYVDLDIFDAVGEAQLADPNLAANLDLLPRIDANPARPDPSDPTGRSILPAQLIFLTPDVRDTLILAELPS